MDHTYFVFSPLKSWCHSLSPDTPLSGQAGNDTQFSRRNLEFIQPCSLQKPSQAWEDKWSREKALYRVLTKQKLKGIFGTGNSDLYGTIPKGKAMAEIQQVRSPRSTGTPSYTEHSIPGLPAQCLSRASVLITFLGNQANCDNSSGLALVLKNLPANAGNARDMGSIPGLGRSP